MIARNNREFAEKKIAKNPYEYKDDDEIVNEYYIDDNEL